MEISSRKEAYFIHSTRYILLGDMALPSWVELPSVIFLRILIPLWRAPPAHINRSGNLMMSEFRYTVNIARKSNHRCLNI